MKNYTTNVKYISSNGYRLKLLILSPNDNKKDHPGVLWIHGGGYITGMASMVYMSRALELVKKYHAVVISPEYRLSKQEPYPAALLDCHHALSYLEKHSDELHIRNDQIMVGGESAGGGLAVSLSMYEKDHHGVNISYLMPLYPMISDQDTITSRDNHAPVWNTKLNHYGWSKYLQNLQGKEIPCYASPSRRKDYSNLPPTYTFVSTNEPFYDETMTYIRNLKLAGVDAKIDVYPGLFHAFDMLLPFLTESKEAKKRFNKQFEYAIEHYYAKQ